MCRFYATAQHENQKNSSIFVKLDSTCKSGEKLVEQDQPKLWSITENTQRQREAYDGRCTYSIQGEVCKIIVFKDSVPKVKYTCRQRECRECLKLPRPKLTSSSHPPEETFSSVLSQLLFLKRAGRDDKAACFESVLLLRVVCSTDGNCW